MIEADGPSDGPDELELLREEARAMGMPKAVNPADVGITMASAHQVLERAKARSSEPPRDATSVTLLSSRRKRTALRLGGIAAAIVGVAAVSLTPWQQDTAAALTPPVLDYEFANAQNIAFAPGQDARGTLLELSRAASEQASVPLDGESQYLVTDNWFATLETTKAPELIPKQRQTWLRPDGSVRLRETSGEPLSPDGRGLTSGPSQQTNNTVDETYPPGDIDPQFVARLGTKPSSIRDTLLEESQCQSRVPSPTRASCLFGQISSIYDQYVVPTATAGALWRVLADEPAVRSLGTVEDRAGRRGIGISLVLDNAPQFRRVLIISPTTGELLGTEDILIKDDPDVGVRAPAIYSFTAILESRYVTEPGA